MSDTLAMIEHLRSHPFTADLGDDDLHILLPFASPVHYEAREIIYREREKADACYLIEKGDVVVSAFVPQRGTVPVHTLHDGEVLGWSWLFEPYEWHFDAQAASSVDAIRLDGEGLRTLCEDTDCLACHIVRRFAGLMMQQLHATRLRLVNVYR